MFGLTLKDAMYIVLAVQVITMFILGTYFWFANGHINLGVAQFLLGIVTVLIYSGGV